MIIKDFCHCENWKIHEIYPHMFVYYRYRKKINSLNFTDNGIIKSQVISISVDDGVSLYKYRKKFDFRHRYRTLI